MKFTIFICLSACGVAFALPPWIEPEALPPWIDPTQVIEPRQATCPTLPSFMTSSDRIVNGQDAPSPIPWQISLQAWNNAGNHWCGGSILDSKTILTAAHCVDSPGVDYSNWGIMAGTTNKNQGQQIKIAQRINHPDWDADLINNDLAILKLSEPLVLGDNVQPICLPDGPLELEDGADCYASGWGATQYEPVINPDDLQWTKMPLFSDAKCKNAWGVWFRPESMICAGHEAGVPGTCNGDSGGPLVCMKDNNLFLAGAVSYGYKGCVQPGFPKVFARVSSFLPWIKSHMEPEPEPTTTTEAPEGCAYPHWQGDNWCDDDNNNAGCNYDGGDCCGDDVKTDYCTACECLEPECEYPHWEGDGWCDDGNNHIGCNYDGGDCCGDNVKTSYCDICECIDPNSF